MNQNYLQKSDYAIPFSCIKVVDLNGNTGCQLNAVNNGL